MDIVLATFLGVAAAFGIFELYGWYQTSREPDAPGRETDPTRDAEAVVIEPFVPIAGTDISGGRVELKGAQWFAENHTPGIDPEIGQRVRVVERRSLTLIVEPYERVQAVRRQQRRNGV